MAENELEVASKPKPSSDVLYEQITRGEFGNDPVMLFNDYLNLRVGELEHEIEHGDSVTIGQGAIDLVRVDTAFGPNYLRAVYCGAESEYYTHLTQVCN